MCCGTRTDERWCRLTNREVVLGPYRVPQNVMVYVLFYRMHNSPKLWDMPEAFLPERWSGQGEGTADTPVSDASASGRGEEGLTRNEKKYLPFSEGPRGCLGQVSCLWVLTLQLQRYLSFHTDSHPPSERRGWPSWS